MRRGCRWTWRGQSHPAGPRAIVEAPHCSTTPGRSLAAIAGMKHIALIAILAACGMDAPTTHTSPDCAAAESYQDIGSIETKIFGTSCTFSQCHDGGAATSLDLRTGHAYAALVGVASHVDASRMRVVPNHTEQSILMVMLGAVDPGEMLPPLTAVPKPGVMPLANVPLCAE